MGHLHIENLSAVWVTLVPWLVLALVMVFGLSRIKSKAEQGETDESASPVQLADVKPGMSSATGPAASASMSGGVTSTSGGAIQTAATGGGHRQ